MKMNRIFAALCAIVALGVSCQKEMTVKTDSEEIIVPEGMKYVSFEVGAPTKITGNPVKWTSGKESIAVLAVLGGESKTYEFETAGTGSIVATTTISGLVDEGAELKFVLFPYNENDCIDLTNDPSGNTISLHKLASFSYLQASGVASTSPFACKIETKDGAYSAASNMKPLYSFLKVILPSRATDKTSDGKTAKPTSYVEKLEIEGTGIAGATSIDFSGEEPNVVLSGTAEKSTINVTTKTDNNSKLPADGYYLVPIVPGIFNDLKITAQYVATSAGVQYPDYTAEFSNSNTFTRGKYKSIELSGPFVTSATTVSAVVDGSTLTMTGSAVFYTGGKVTESDYTFGFNYREKGTEEWTPIAAIYADNNFTSNVTVASGKTYEVKAYVVAPDAIVKEEVVVDQTVEGEIVESSGYVPPIVITVDKFSLKPYDGTAEGGYWQYIGSDPEYVYPSAKAIRVGIEDTYAYYANKTDVTPLVSGIKIKASSSNGYYIGNQLILHYGSGYFEFPGMSGYKVTNVAFTMNGSSLNKDVVLTTAATTSVSFSSGKYESASGGKLLGKDTYSPAAAKDPVTFTFPCSGDDNGGIRIWGGGSYNYTFFEITYEKVY